MKDPVVIGRLPIWWAPLLIACLLGIPVANAQQPNIVFFLADDQTTNTLGAYGNRVIQTPNIDRLARQGVRFENAFVSQSICWVSRTTILTGLTGRSYGEPGHQEMARGDAVKVLYPDLLRNSGYRTGYFGKWHAVMPESFNPEDHFDAFEAIGRNPYYKPQADGSLRHESELIVDRGIEFIRSQPEGKPFALNLWFNAGHAEDGDRRPGIGHFPWPRAVDGMYASTEIEPPRLNDPATFDALPDFLRTTINRERYFWRWNTPSKYQANMRAYYRMISGIDGAIGRFLAALEEAGLAGNTIIVYSADNGYYAGNRGLAGKWSHFDESLRVPLIIADPRVGSRHKGRVADVIALNLDLPSTFLDWAGVTVPERYQGRSLSPVVVGQQPGDWRTESFHEHFAVRSRIPAFEGVRNRLFKYVRYVDHDNHEFLHDLKKDPNELVNVANDPAYAETLDAMRERTRAKVEQLGGSLGPAQHRFTASTVAHPESSAGVGASRDAEGFVSLFDGSSLRGWAGNQKLWFVEQGLLTGVSDGSLTKNRSLTWMHSTLRNFDLRARVRVSRGGNSGFVYRATSHPRMGLDAVGDSATASWVVGAPTSIEFSANRWHDVRVLARGNHHQHWIDGVKVLDLRELDSDESSLEGLLGVQLSVGPAMKIQYQNVRVKLLPDDPV